MIRALKIINRKILLEPGMGEWLEKTSLKKCHVNSLLNREVESAMCTSGGKSIPGRGPREYKGFEVETN